mmetsp:Transcript_35088/g.53835  ORF Transcript_35088/g.53835 Transcript_35088/m.53835 type:complete len:97 (-) Transcript_35088:60-350(-)
MPALESQVMLVTEIKDDGWGMDKAQQKSLFKLFDAIQRRKKSTSGQGLGLFLSQQLTLFLQGRIDVESKKEIGTTVRVFLPLDLSTNSDSKADTMS